VLGHPISHSLSPVLHRAAYRRLGLDWTFDAVDVTPAELPGFVSGAAADPAWRGLALTMPLKVAVLPLLDSLDATAELVGAANTLLFEPSGERRGANTDVPGLTAALAEAGVSSDGPALDATIFGGGATASSAVAALARLGSRRITLRARDAARAAGPRAVAARCDVDLRVQSLDAPWQERVDVLVSTIPSPVAAAVVPDSVWSARAAHERAVVADVVYDPWPSPLLERAGRAGAELVTGIDLLAHQAALQLRLMTDADVDVALLRSAGLEATPGADLGSALGKRTASRPEAD
jgi:shikimate dehydrogenase